MISLIVAHDLNRVIGNNGKIPWKITGEQLRFKKLTQGKTIIMGRKSFEEIGKPLPNRKTILISSKLKYVSDDCITMTDLNTALEVCGDKDVYISGGASLYREAVKYVDKMYITVIQNEYAGDTFFPEVDYELFEKVYEKYVPAETPYINYTYVRRSCDSYRNERGI